MTTMHSDFGSMFRGERAQHDHSDSDSGNRGGGKCLQLDFGSMYKGGSAYKTLVQCTDVSLQIRLLILPPNPPTPPKTLGIRNPRLDPLHHADLVPVLLQTAQNWYQTELSLKPNPEQNISVGATRNHHKSFNLCSVHVHQCKYLHLQQPLSCVPRKNEGSSRSIITASPKMCPRRFESTTDCGTTDSHSEGWFDGERDRQKETKRGKERACKNMKGERAREREREKKKRGEK